MIDEPEPHLVLHKVRGQPAFDIACLIGHDGDGEEMWIIPTSGHRTYPLRQWNLGELWVHVEVSDGRIDELSILDELCRSEMPDPWPDHYSCNNPSTKPTEPGTNLLDRLGLTQKVDRRF